MLTIAPAQYRALETDQEQRLGARLRRDFARVNPRSPLLADDRWDAWWRETLEHGRAWKGENTHTLSIHALLRFLYGPDYLQRPDLAWLAGSLVSLPGEPPDYREIDGMTHEVLDVIDAMWMESA